MKPSLLLVTTLLVFSTTSIAASPATKQDKQLKLMQLEQSATLDKRIDQLLEAMLRQTSGSMYLLDAASGEEPKTALYAELLLARSK